MKAYKAYLEQLEYAKTMYGIYGFEKHLYTNEIYFKLFMSLGFQNLNSYYSIVLHERYYKDQLDKQLFVFRNGGEYSFEFNEEPVNVIKVLKDEVYVRQSDPFTIHLSAFSSYVIKIIDKTYFS